MQLGERIRQLREKRRWSQEQLAIQARRFSPDIKLARETVSRIENGRNAPDMWVVEVLCKVFGVGLGEFFTDSASYKPQQVVLRQQWQLRKLPQG